MEDLDRGPRLFQLELALQNMNSGQGLGFMIADIVLDKKKLRTIYGAVAGLFSTVIPLMATMIGSSAAVPVYGSFPHSPTVYACEFTELHSSVHAHNIMHHATP